MYSYKYKNTVVAILLACILTMAIGYAALQQRLNITGTSSISSTYNVKIIDIYGYPSNENVTDKVAPSYTDTTATFSTNLTSPGDYMTYYIEIANLGTLDAKLDLITVDDSNNPAIEFIYEGVEEGDILPSQDFVVMTVTVKYSDTVTTQPNSVSSDLTIKLDYSQYIPEVNEEIVIDGDYLAQVYMPEWEEATGWLNSSFKLKDVESINFSDTNDIPAEAGNNYWDASNAQNGSIIGWYIDSDSDGLYEVTIGQDGGVVANPNSSYLFTLLVNLSSIDFTNFNTSYVTNMSRMFYGNVSLKSLDLRKFDVSNVTDMSHMFAGIYAGGEAASSLVSSLETINMSGWDTSKVTNMDRMFNAASSIKTLDLSGFNTSNVTNMYSMFNYMISLETLDLSSFNTANVYDIDSMFEKCYNLKTIYVSDLWSNDSVEFGDYVFNGAYLLTGGSGVTYDDNKTDVSMANYETGYFTYKANN